MRFTRGGLRFTGIGTAWFWFCRRFLVSIAVCAGSTGLIIVAGGLGTAFTHVPHEDSLSTVAGVGRIELIVGVVTLGDVIATSSDDHGDVAFVGAVRFPR